MQADPLLSESPGEAQLDKIIDDISNEKCFCLVLREENKSQW